VTIWPGPFIGGYIAGSLIAASPQQALKLGLFMFLLMLGPLYLILFWVHKWFNDLFGDGGPLILLIGVAILSLYVGFLGALGAIVGGSAARKNDNTLLKRLPK
jgi:hypothetical protein